MDLEKLRYSSRSITPTTCGRCNEALGAHRRMKKNWVVQENMIIHGDQSENILKLYTVSLRKCDEDITNIWSRGTGGVMREEDHECMVFAYRKILQSHGDNLKLANIDPRICSPAALEKEIFRIFADCMKWIKRIRTTAEQNIKRIAAYQIMITEANHMVYTCLSDNPDPHDALGDRENHAKIHYTAACHACDNASYITERHFRPIDIPSMTACYHNATLKRRHRDSVGLWFQTLDHTLKKIDHDLSEDKESLESYDESVEWWYNRLRKALKEGREEQDAANLLMSLKSSRDRFHRHFPSHP